MKITTSLPFMEVMYQWILKDIKEEPKTFSSKMILFRGEEVFRVALKNEVKKQTLMFVSINLNKIGMKVHEVLYSNQNLENSMEPLVKQNSGNDTTLQVFSIDLKKRISGKTILNFYIRTEGTVKDFSYQLADRLLKKQLSKAIVNLQWTDINLIVQGKKIPAHKCVLAARSPVFATEFAKNRKITQIVINDVDFSIAGQFLYFLYTGEPRKSFANEQLLKLAIRYQLVTLVSLCLCDDALRNIVTKEMANTLISFTPEKKPMLAFEICPTEDTEVHFDPNTSTFLANWCFKFDVNQDKIKQELFEYQNGNRFSAHIVGDISYIYYWRSCITNPAFRLVYVDHGNSNYRILEAVCTLKRNDDSSVFKWLKMKQRSFQENESIVSFLAPTSDSLQLNSSRFYTLSFRIKLASTIENYHYEMMDTTCAAQLWTAAINRHMTDVEISVGSRKFEAHRVVLAARSPVFCALLNKNKTIAKSSITVNKTVDSDTFQHFLEFLYTGTLKISANNKQLLGLAEMYEVETLKKLCERATRELDGDKLTSSFMAVL